MSSVRGYPAASPGSRARARAGRSAGGAGGAQSAQRLLGDAVEQARNGVGGLTSFVRQRAAHPSAANGRVTTPEYVANVIVFLCSQANGNVTGETLRADGHFLAIAA